MKIFKSKNSFLENNSGLPVEALHFLGANNSLLLGAIA
jgi:hypothetical protein